MPRRKKKTKKRQRGGVRFSDIITVENRDRFIGQEIEIVSITDLIPRETDLTGKEAYAIYGKEVVGHLEKVGGKPIFGANVERLMLGEVEDLWDQVAVAMYPSRKAMLKMITDPDYIESAQHRVAGLEGQLNIETSLDDSLLKDNA